MKFFTRSVFKNSLKRLKSQPIWFHLFWIIWTIYLAVVWSLQYVLIDQTLYAGWVGSWADGAAHLTFSAKFAYGNIWDFEHPIYAGHRFTYPFVADALIGLMVRWSGVSLFVAHQVFGLVMSLVILGCLYKFYKYFFQNKAGAVLGVNIFLLSGGLGFWIFLQDIYKNGWWQTVSELAEYTQRSDYGLEWMNYISAQLIPQRALSLGIPLGLLILSFFWQLIDSKKQKFSAKIFFGLGLLLGIMPFIHSHTFLVLTGYMAWTVLLTIRKIKFKWLYFLIPYLLVAGLWAVFIILPSTSDSSFITWNPGWMAVNHSKNWLLFWWWNWGIFTPLALIGFYSLKKPMVIKVFPFVAVFILANLWLFQPYDWDNTKFLSWVHLVFSGVVGWQLALIGKNGKLAKIGVAMVLIILTFSGTLQAIRLLQFKHMKIPMYSVEELKLVEKIRQTTSVDSMFLTSDKHHHPIPNLTGRKIIMGYPGWLWTYGFNYYPQSEDIRTMYKGGPKSEELLEQYGVDYVVFDSSLPADLSANETYFSASYSLFIKTINYRIYQIQP